MDARLQLYNDIKTTIEATVPEVKHIALWNQDTLFLDQDAPWARPAVFIEFGAIEWTCAKEAAGVKSARGIGQIYLHTVTDWKEGAYEEAFDIEERVWAAIDDMERTPAAFVSAPKQTQTNHNHDELLEHVDSYVARYLKQWQ